MKKDDGLVICPYYGSCTPQWIICGGMLSGTELTKTKFVSTAAREEHMDEFCKTYCWQGCVIAQAIDEIMGCFSLQNEAKNKNNVTPKK